MTFDPEGHVYRIDGDVVPSVTQILKAGGLIGDWGGRYPEAAARGTLVHRLCEELDTYGDTLADTEGVEGYLAAYRDFIKAQGVVSWEAVEAVVAGDGWAGQVDRVGEVGGRVMVIDIKTGSAASWHKAQLWAYREAFELRPFTPGRMPLAALYLKADGRYSLKVVSPREEEEAARMWGGAWAKYNSRPGID